MLVIAEMGSFGRVAVPGSSLETEQGQTDKRRNGRQRHDASSFGLGHPGATSADLKAANHTAELKLDTEAVVDLEVKFELEHLVPVKTALHPSTAPAAFPLLKMGLSSSICKMRCRVLRRQMIGAGHQLWPKHGPKHSTRHQLVSPGCTLLHQVDVKSWL